MGNTDQPNAPEQPNAADLTLEERIRALELQVAEQCTGAKAPGTTPGERPMRQAELSAELQRHRDQLRDYEKALVERIADVDDDRRATTARLQRAWQTQREEIDERLRRHAGLIAGLLLLFAVLVSVALFLVYRQGTTEQPQVTAEVAAMRQELDRISADDRSSDGLKVELEQLGKDVEEMRRLKGEQTSFAAKTEFGVAEEIRRLKAEQASLASEVGTLRAALAAAKNAGGAAAPAEEVPGAAAEPSPGEPKANEATDGGTPATESGTHDSAAEMQEGASDSAGARADADADALGSEETLVAREDSYALQLIGFFDRGSLAEFAAREGLPPRVYYLRQAYKGRPWYAMVHSLHKSYAAAVAELSRLPADLVALGPWIRPVAAGTVLQVLETGAGR